MSENLPDQNNQESDKTTAIACKVDLPPKEFEEESTRSQKASRAFRAAVVGLVLLPLELFVPRGQTVFQIAFFFPSLILIPYSIWLLYQVFVSKEKLERRPRRLAVLAGVINCSVLLFPFLFLVSLLVPQRDPRFDYPVEMVGTWTTDNGALVMELRKNGKLVYRAKGPPEIEFSGIWGLGDSRFFFEVRRIIKGADVFPFPKDQLLTWDFRHYTYWEIVFGGKEKIRLVRKK